MVDLIDLANVDNDCLPSNSVAQTFDHRGWEAGNPTENHLTRVSRTCRDFVAHCDTQADGLDRHRATPRGESIPHCFADIQSTCRVFFATRTDALRLQAPHPLCFDARSRHPERYA